MSADNLKCKICGFEDISNLIDHIESKHQDLAMKDKNLGSLEAYFMMFNADVDDVVIGQKISLREELNQNLGLNIPDHSDLDFMKPELYPKLTGKPASQVLWYDIVYQDEDLMEQFLIQMAEYNAPHKTFQKYAKEMFGEDYWIRVNDLATKQKCLEPYREGDDGGGMAYLLWEEEEGERRFNTYKSLLINAKDLITFETEVMNSLGEYWVTNGHLILANEPELKFTLEQLQKQRG